MAFSRYTDIDSGNKRLPPIFGLKNHPLLSLDEAVQPIVPQILNLMEYVKIAKEHCHQLSEHGLTKDESASIYLYTMEWNFQSLYIMLNRALRSENRSDLIPWFGYLKLFQTAIDKLPSIKQNLWRGIDKNMNSTYKKGDAITWWAVSSCSEDIGVIRSFLGQNRNSTLFMIEASNGKSISKYSSFKNENEILLAPCTSLRVLANSLEHSGLHVVHLRELTDITQPNDSPLMTNKSTTFYANYRHLFSAVFFIVAGLSSYPIAIRFRDIGHYARLSAASPYPPVPISRLARFAIIFGPILNRAGLFSSILGGIGLLIGIRTCL